MSSCNRRFAVALAFLPFANASVAGCGGSAVESKMPVKDAIAAKPNAGPAKTNAAEPAAKEESDTETAAAPTDRFALPNLDGKLDAPKSVTLGNKTLTAEACLLDTSAPAMRHEWFDQAIRGLVASSDGSLYVLDHEHKIRHYLVEPGEQCKLALDQAFGEHGVLKLDFEPDSIFPLDDGSVIATTGILEKTAKIKNGTPTAFNCKLRVANADGKTGYYFFGSELSKVEIGAECSIKPIKYTGWAKKDDDAPNLLFVGELGKDFLIAASEAGTHYVAIHGPDGKMKVKLGKDREKDKAKDEELICWARDAKPCSAGICVIDSNCRKLSAYDTKKGTLVGAFPIGDLLGLSYPWPAALALGKGVAWIAASNKEEKPKNATRDTPDMSAGLIFRVKGLN